MNLLKILPILFILLANPTHASIATQEKMLIKQAEQLKLAKHPYWLKLLHYSTKPIFSKRSSDILSSKFFVSKKGKTDPNEELKETIISFLKINNKINEHTICIYPARFKWLKKQLNWTNIKIQKPSCPKYEKWTKNGKIKSISLIFATGYLSNPASFFGHPLLKYNTGDFNSPTLTDQAVNYGALTPKTVNPFIYAMKGLFGGYKAAFTHTEYFHHNHNYSENELRDMWEYKLNFDKDQMAQIIDHNWELMLIRFPYYFFSDNCAYRMAELLNLVNDTPLLPKNKPYSIPFTLFDSLANKKFQNGKSITSKVKYIASRQSKLISSFKKLGKDQQKLVQDYTKTGLNFKNKNFITLSTNNKTKVVDTLLDYYLFRLVGDKENKSFLQTKKQILMQRLRLPMGTSKEAIKNNGGPHEGQKPVKTAINFVQNKDRTNAIEINLRPAHYDLLAPEIGRPKNSSLIIFNTKIQVTEKKVSLQSLELAEVITLNISQTGLENDGGLAWRFNMGVNRQDVSCEDCSIFRMYAGIGKAFQLSPKLVFYSLMNVQAQNSRNEYSSFSLTPEISLIANVSKFWKSHISVGERKFFNSIIESELLFKWENRFIQSRFWDIRFSFEKNNGEEFKLGYSKYW